MIFLDSLKVELSAIKNGTSKSTKPDFEKIMENFTKTFYGMVCQ
jgi:hypothetical protein